MSQSEYQELATQSCQFAVDLLEQCRTTEEVTELLHRQHGEDSTYRGPKYSRLSYALDSDQKSVSFNLPQEYVVYLLPILDE